MTRSERCVDFDGQQREVDWTGEPIKLSGYIINEFEFVGVEVNGEEHEANGCVFEIEPGRSTGVMRITDEKLHCQRAAAKGHGYGLLVTPEGIIEVYIMDGEDGDIPIGLDAGGVDCFIASPNQEGNFEVVDVSTPPFEPNMETEVTEADEEVPKDFWEIKKLLSQGKIDEVIQKYPDLVIDLAELRGEL